MFCKWGKGNDNQCKYYEMKKKKAEIEEIENVEIMNQKKKRAKRIWEMRCFESEGKEMKPMEGLYGDQKEKKEENKECDVLKVKEIISDAEMIKRKWTKRIREICKWGEEN